MLTSKVARLSVFLTVVLALSLSAAGQDAAEDGTPYPAPSHSERVVERGRIGKSLLSRLNTPASVPVIISLENQPTHNIATDVQARYAPQLRANERAIRDIERKYSTNARPKTMEEAAAAAARESKAISSQDRARVAKLNQELKSIKDAMRRDIEHAAEQAVAQDQRKLTALVASVGGAVTYTYWITNAVAAQVPGTAIGALANHPLVRYVVEDGLSEAQLNVSVPSINAATFYNAGQTGGIWWNATMDTGVDTSHPALSSVTWWEGVFHDTASSQSVYNDNSSSTDDLQGHGTHVAGIMNSDNSTYRGVSYGSTKSTNLKAGFRRTNGNGSMYDSDAMKAVHWGFSNAVMDVINLSFGGDTTDSDSDYARFWDSVVSDMDTLAVIAAGNSGPGDSTVTNPGIFYNGLTVANVNDMGTTDRGDDVIANSSGRGPISDNRKKPDIAAPGTSIMSCNNQWEGITSDFVNKTGTSMAAPHVAGAATLLHDVGVHDPRVIKAILINTADYIDGNTTWSKEYGWGYINLNQAYLRRTNYFLHSVTPRNTTGEYKLYKVANPQVGDKATMVWNRRVTYNDSSFPTTYYSLSDLNLRMYRESNNYSLDTSLSGPDNVEQVVSPTSQPVVLRAYAWSTAFSGASTETFALAVPPGTVAANGPVLNPSSSSSTYNVPVGAKFAVKVRLTNNGDLAAHNCTLNLSLPSGVSLVSGSLSNNIGTLEAGASSDWVEIWLRPTTTGAKTVTLSAGSNSYGISTWSGSGSFTINPGPADVTPPETIAKLTGGTYLAWGTDNVNNGGFESSLTGWTASGSVSTSTGVFRSGARAALVGASAVDGSIEQTVTLPSASSAHLEFWAKTVAGSSFFSGAGVSILDAGGTFLFTPWSSSVTSLAFQKVHIDLSKYAGQTIKLRFYGSSGFLGSVATQLYLDDVRLLTGPTLYVRSNASYHLMARDSGGAGVDSTQHRWGTSGFWLLGTDFNVPSSDGDYTVQYLSKDNSGNLETATSYGVTVDDLPPVSTLRIGSPNVISGGTQTVSNGGFENGLVNYIYSGSAQTTTVDAHSGLRALNIGSGGAVGHCYQQISLTSGSRPVLSFWYKASGTSLFSSGGLQIRSTDNDILASILNTASNTGWKKITTDLSAFAGRTIRLYFYASNSFLSSAPEVWFDGASLVENPTVYVAASSTQSMFARDAGSGVASTDHRVDSGTWLEGTTVPLSGSGMHIVDYRAFDNLSNAESINSAEITVDDAGPTGSIVIEGGAVYTTSTTVNLQLAASDPVGMSLMRIKDDAGVWGGWVFYSPSTTFTLATSGDGAKTVSVQFTDQFGNVSSEYSDTIEYRSAALTDIPGAKQLPDDKGVALSGKIVTAIFPNSGYFYISEPDRRAGIRVRSAEMPGSVNSFVDVQGVTATVYAEREIVATRVVSGKAAPAVTPLELTNSALGGAAYHYQPGVPGSFGLNNIGLLVRTTGRVTDVVGSAFFIDDGTGLSDAVRPGLTVTSSSFTGPMPAVGDYVAVTGISGVETLSGTPIRCLRIRSASDLQYY